MEKPEISGEKVFSQTTKTLLQRYRQTSCHVTALTRSDSAVSAHVVTNSDLNSVPPAHPNTPAGFGQGAKCYCR